MAWHAWTIERRRAGTSTLSLLYLSSAALVLSLAVLWTVVATTTTSRLRAAGRMPAEALSLLGEARDLYIALGDADATASRELLLERTGDVLDERARYEQDLHRAGELLASIASDASDSQQIRTGVEGIAASLPEYAADVDAARANNRQGFPVAAAYLRDASELMQHDILAAATSVYDVAMERMDNAGRAASRRAHVPMIALAGSLALCVLIVVQVFIAVRTRRMLNLGLLGATLVVVMMLAVALTRFAAVQSELSEAQHDGQNTMQTLSVAQMLTLRAQRADAAQLIERSADDDVFTGLADRIGGAKGLISASGDSGHLAQFFNRFIDAHRLVAASDSGGDHPGAVTQFRAAEVTQADELTRQLSSAVGGAERNFVRHTTGAIDALEGLAAGMAAAAFAAMAAGLFGLSRRIKEYQ